MDATAIAHFFLVFFALSNSYHYSPFRLRVDSIPWPVGQRGVRCRRLGENMNIVRAGRGFAWAVLALSTLLPGIATAEVRNYYAEPGYKPLNGPIQDGASPQAVCEEYYASQIQQGLSVEVSQTRPGEWLCKVPKRNLQQTILGDCQFQQKPRAGEDWRVPGWDYDVGDCYCVHPFLFDGYVQWCTGELPDCAANESYDPRTGLCKSNAPPPVVCNADELETEFGCAKRKPELGDGGMCPDEDNDPKMCLDPVNVATGNSFQRETDYASAGGLRFERYYNSLAAAATPMGFNWRHNWSASLKLHHTSSGDRVQVTRADGNGYFFNRVNSAWQNDVDITARLEQTASGWILRDGPTTRETYDAAGRLLRIDSAGGRSFTLAYTNDRLTNVSDAFGRSLTFAYQPGGQLQSFTDPAGRTTSFNNEGRLTGVTYPDGTTRGYHYEDSRFPLALTGITDENGKRFATWTFDLLGRVESSQHANGADYGFIQYFGDRSEIRDSRSATRVIRYTIQHGAYKVTGTTQPCGSCSGSGSSSSTIYDARGFVQTRTDFNGHVTRYTHDDRGLEVSRTEAAGVALQERTIATRWHAAFRLPEEITEPGRRTVYTYTPNGELASETVTDTRTQETRTTRYTYTPAGLLDTVDGPRIDVADVTNYDYDAAGNLIRVTNALGHITQISQHDAHGNPLRILDPNGVETTLTYDFRQRVKSRSTAGATTTFDYDDAGLLEKVTLPNAVEIAYRYDAAQRLTDIVDQAGNRIHYTVNQASDRTKEEVFDPSGALKRVLRQEYDALGRLSKVLGANGQVTTFGYDPQGNRERVTEVTLSRSYPTTTQFDALNRAFRVTDAGNGITTYGYDALDHLRSVTDPKGLTTTYEVNAFGDVTQLASPDTGVTFYAYDSAGNRASQTDARNVTVRYQYDALNRLTFQDYPDVVEDVTYQYDGSNYHVATPNGVGRVTGVTDASGAVTYAYDPRGTLKLETRTIQGRTYVTSYAYDAADNLASITYPSGQSISYSRNNLGRIEGVTLGTLTLAGGIGYQPFGPASAWALGNGLQVTRSFDRDYRLARLGGNAVLDRTQHYDERNQIEAIEDHLDAARSQAFTYDPMARLADAEGAYGIFSYSYDAVGNRQHERHDDVTSPYSYFPSTHRLQSAGGTNYEYDDAGNARVKGSLALTYNAAGRLAQVKRGTAFKGSYVYNAAGQRVMKSAPEAQTDYIALAEAAEAEARVRRQEASRLQSEAQAKEQQADGLTAGAAQKEADASASLKQAAGYRKEAASYDPEIKHHLQKAADHEANATDLRERAAEADRNENLKKRDELLKKAAEQDRKAADDRAEAAAYLAKQNAALANAQQAEAQANSLTQQAAAERATAASLRQQAQTLRTDADEEFTEAQQLDQQALAYRQAAAQQPPPQILTSHFVYDQFGQLLGEYNQSGSPLREYVWLNGEPLALLTAGQLSYFHNDHLGTPQKLTDPTGSIVWDATYAPFGRATADVGEVTQPLRFPGQYFDAETGLHYNWWRYMDPATGRYLESDPIGLLGGANTYLYAIANPTTRVDFYGLDSMLIFTTERNPKRDDAYPWQHVAARMKKNAGQICGECDAEIHDVQRVSQIQDILGQHDDIVRIIIIGHANQDAIYVGSDDAPGTNISSLGGPNDVSPSTLDWSGLQPDARIYILGCKAGKGQNSIAQLISNASGVPVTAPNSYLNFEESGMPFIRHIRHGGWVTVQPQR